ncbi:hypothetical protein [Fusobacterium hwasookii]|uniref:hypothetical protein n=1 Tax=Fusobacterium hwasookii TaxID=1583098 RepID=UPI0004957B50|nr:hypothetical protein [Fusobacterium hwasookii]ALQ36866.1 hypothetical protein RN97_01290 [Fusobacterium hwasookii ChDC F300]
MEIYIKTIIWILMAYFGLIEILAIIACFYFKDKELNINPRKVTFYIFFCSIVQIIGYFLLKVI